ncbi:MAG: T9SS type A sorting domain-containing protein, partial [Bacteroidia bacterium]|nr:T9SS type A sorting domain-containing protein [Bacteroidia bacterium]
TAAVQVMDISGRIVRSESLGKLDSGELTYSFNTGDLSTGIYMVNVQSTSGVKRVAKLIVTK